jgi:hypothetical protein
MTLTTLYSCHVILVVWIMMCSPHDKVKGRKWTLLKVLHQRLSGTEGLYEADKVINLANLRVYSLGYVCSRLNRHLLPVTSSGIDCLTEWTTFESENTGKECSRTKILFHTLHCINIYKEIITCLNMRCQKTTKHSRPLYISVRTEDVTELRFKGTL